MSLLVGRDRWAYIPYCHQQSEREREREKSLSIKSIKILKFLNTIFLIWKHTLVKIRLKKKIFKSHIHTVCSRNTSHILVWFYGISTIEGYLISNPLYTHMICKHILLIMFLNEPKLILLHTVKWFQVLLCITNNSIKHQSFIYTV